MMLKKLFLDPVSINQSAKTEFNSSEDWPLKEKKFHNFSDKLYQNYYKLINKSTNEIFYICLVETHMISQLLTILHYNYVEQYCKHENIKIECSWQSYSARKPDWKKVQNFYTNYAFAHGKIRRKIRRLVKHFFFNKKKNFFSLIKSFFYPKNISIGSFDYLKQIYMQDKKFICSHYDWIDLIDIKKTFFNKLNKSNKEKEDKTLKYIKNNIINPFLFDLYKNRENDLFVKNISKGFLVDIWTKRFEGLIKLFLMLKTESNINRLLVSELGNPFHKIIMYASHLKGTEVISFNHGNDFGAANYKWAHQSLISHSIKYCFENEQIKKNFENSKPFRPLENYTKTKYLSLNSNRFQLIRNNHAFFKPYNNKTIMVIGFPMHINRYVDPKYSFFHYKLKIEIEIGKSIKKIGYSSIYKAHPGRIKEVGNIVSCHYDLLLTKNFEKVWKRAGVLIFTSLGTTVFGYAINLPIPIIYFNSTGTPIDQKKVNLLKKRIVIIESVYKQGAYTISSSVLREAIQKAKKNVNLVIAKKLMG